MKLLIDPHGDDAALFAAYTCIAEDVVVCVTHPTVPEEEIAAAMFCLGCHWGGPRTPLDGEPELIYAPAPHPEGHPEHNAAMSVVYWDAPVRYYATYAPRGQRQRTDNEVIPPAGAVAKKLRALSCYESQIEQESTRPWFTNLLDMREWISP